MKGNVSIEYLLVVALVVLGLVAAVYGTGKRGENLGSAFVKGYYHLTHQVSKP